MPEHGFQHSENEIARNALLQQVAVLESEMEDTRKVGGNSTVGFAFASVPVLA